MHDFLERPLLHLSVCICHIRIRHQSCHPIRNILDSVHPVINIIHLSVSSKLTFNRLTDNLVVMFHHKSLYRQTVYRRLIQYTHITDAHKAHMQGSRNRRCCQGQHIDIILHMLDALLMRYAKALLLIHYQKPQTLETDVLRQQAMRSDQDIYPALRRIGNNLLLLRCRTEA